MFPARAPMVQLKQQFRDEHAFAADQGDDLLQGRHGRLHVGDQHGIELAGDPIERGHYWHTDEMRALRSAIDHSGNLDAIFRRTDHRDFGEVGNAGKRDPHKPAFRAGLQGEIAVGLRPAKETEG
jgi:hypothetical protein